MNRSPAQTRALTNQLYALAAEAITETDQAKKLAGLQEAKKFADEHKLPFVWDVSATNEEEEDEDEYEDSDYENSDC